MGNMKNWMLGAAVVAGGFGMGAGTAQAAEFGVHSRGPAAYVPPRPGPNHTWVAGYQANGYWIPGRWAQHDGRNGASAARFDRDREAGRGYDRRGDRGRDGDRGRR
jgi:hypothetical protein